MITGGDGERIGDIIEGIKIVDSIEVLGVKIDRKLQNLDENWEKTLRNMKNLEVVPTFNQWKSNDSKDILNFASHISYGSNTNWG